VGPRHSGGHTVRGDGNYVRKEVYELFADVRPLEDFLGAICGGVYDRDMQQEAGMLSAMYAVNIGMVAEKRRSYEDGLTKAQEELDGLSGGRSSGFQRRRQPETGVVPQA
jgi:hypothetical protein